MHKSSYNKTGIFWDSAPLHPCYKHDQYTQKRGAKMKKNLGGDLILAELSVDTNGNHGNVNALSHLAHEILVLYYTYMLAVQTNLDFSESWD